MAPSDATARFSTRVAHYVRYRPQYPAAMYALLRDLGFVSGATVADVGFGTGIFAEPLLKDGLTVYCVEPNRPMREAAEQLLARYGGFRSVAAPAEATTLPDQFADFVTCAQPFHWFDRDRAKARVPTDPEAGRSRRARVERAQD